MDNRDWTVQEAREHLATWRSAHNRRDRIVIKAHEAGLDKSEIHRLTGIARSTIDRILEDR